MKKYARNHRVIEEIDRLISEGVYKHITEAADKLGTYPTILSNIRKNIREVPESLIDALSKYGISKSYLYGFDGEGNSLNILFVNKQIVAGYEKIDYSELVKTSDTQRFSLPNLGLEGELFAFPIDGDSMLPIFNKGDIVICRQIEDLEEIKDNSIYALIFQNEFLLKRLRKKRFDGQIVGIDLISENSLYPQRVIENRYLESVRSNIFRVLKKISIEDI